MRDADAEFADYVACRSSALLRTAFLLCGGDRGHAEDLLQDVLERVYPRWRKIKDRPDAYVRAALANAAANRWRRRSRRVLEAPLEPESHAGGTGHEQGVADRDLVVRALRELPPRMRAVIVLRFFEDMTEAEAAVALRCSVGTVKSQTSRALAKLREQLRTADGDSERMLTTNGGIDRGNH